MLLLWAVLIGLIAGGARAIYARRSFTIPDLAVVWLAPLAFLPQCIFLATHAHAHHR